MRRNSLPWVSVAFALLFLLPLSGADWTQLKGDEARSGIASLPNGPVDIVAAAPIAAYDTLSDGERLGYLRDPFLVAVPGGAAGIVHSSYDNETCQLVTVRRSASGEIASHRTEGRGCPFGSMQAYIPDLDAVLLCAMGNYGDPVLQLRSRADFGGGPVWGVSPQQLDLLVANLETPSVDDSVADVKWTCAGSAVDFAAREVVAIFGGGAASLFDRVRHRIAAIDLDTGEVKWSFQVNHAAAVLAAHPELMANAPDGSAGHFWPLSVTLSPTGIAVTGTVGSLSTIGTGYPTYVPQDTDVIRPATGTEAAVAWLDRDGQGLNGFLRARITFDPLLRQADEGGLVVRASSSGSAGATVAAGLAAIAMGDRLVLFDPAEPGILETGPLPSGPGLERSTFTGWPTPTWAGEQIVVPLDDRVVVFHENDLSTLRVVYSSPGAFIADTLLTSGGDLYVLTTRSDVQGSMSLARIELSSGAVRQEFTFHHPKGLHHHPWADALCCSFRLPIPPAIIPYADDSFIVTNPAGSVVYFGPAPTSRLPMVEVSNAYPSVGQAMHLSIQAPTGLAVDEVTVRWGDASPLERLASAGPSTPMHTSHRYATDGHHEVLVTLTFEDGTTATSAITLDVGGTPPPRLSFIQQAFAPANQDMTWGVIGLFVVLLGGAATLIARRVGRSRIASGLAELADIRNRSVVEPLDALSELQSWHGHQEERLLRGRLTEDQFRVLENRGGRLMRSVTQAVLEPVADSLPDSLARKLDAAYRDGFVDPGEVAGLRSAAAGLKLSTGDRRVLDGVFDAWSHRHDTP